MFKIILIVFFIVCRLINLKCLCMFLLFVKRLGVGIFIKEILELFVLLWIGFMIGLMFNFFIIFLVMLIGVMFFLIIFFML